MIVSLRSIFIGVHRTHCAKLSVVMGTTHFLLHTTATPLKLLDHHWVVVHCLLNSLERTAMEEHAIFYTPESVALDVARYYCTLFHVEVHSYIQTDCYHAMWLEFECQETLNRFRTVLRDRQTHAYLTIPTQGQLSTIFGSSTSSDDLASPYRRQRRSRIYDDTSVEMRNVYAIVNEYNSEDKIIKVLEEEIRNIELGVLLEREERNSALLDVDNMSYEELIELGDSIGKVGPQGLTSNQVASLFMYTATAGT